jgi:hypothetical protein
MMRTSRGQEDTSRGHPPFLSESRTPWRCKEAAAIDQSSKTLTHSSEHRAAASGHRYMHVQHGWKTDGRRMEDGWKTDGDGDGDGDVRSSYFVRELCVKVMCGRYVLRDEEGAQGRCVREWEQ